MPCVSKKLLACPPSGGFGGAATRRVFPVTSEAPESEAPEAKPGRSPLTVEKLASGALRNKKTSAEFGAFCGRHLQDSDKILGLPLQNPGGTPGF